MTDVELALKVAFYDDISLPQLLPCSIMLPEQIVYA